MFEKILLHTENINPMYMVNVPNFIYLHPKGVDQNRL